MKTNKLRIFNYITILMAIIVGPVSYLIFHRLSISVVAATSIMFLRGLVYYIGGIPHKFPIIEGIIDAILLYMLFGMISLYICEASITFILQV